MIFFLIYSSGIFPEENFLQFFQIFFQQNQEDGRYGGHVLKWQQFLNADKKIVS